MFFRFLGASFYRRNPRSLGRSPRENHLLFPLNECTDRNGKAPTTRISWSSSGPLRAFCFPPGPSLFSPFFSFFFYFLPSCSRVRPQGFDGPRGDFPDRRGPTEGASHTRLGHEPRPSDLLKISIALVHRPSHPPSRARRKAQTGPPSTALLPPLHPIAPALFFARVPPSFSLPRAVGTSRHR